MPPTPTQFLESWTEYIRDEGLGPEALPSVLKEVQADARKEGLALPSFSQRQAWI
jgi:hypothetical protein